MQKGNVIAVLATTFFYLGVGCFGYAAFGNAAPATCSPASASTNPTGS